MIKNSEKDWFSIVGSQFEHPAIILWRAVELRHIGEALKECPLREPVLDIGCAEGKISGLLFGDKRLNGLDNCWGLLRQNRKSDIYRTLILADACYLPYKNDAFSSIFSNCVIEHIPDLDRVLSEAARVLKDKGIFLFSVPSDKFRDFLFFAVIFEKLRLKKLSFWYKRKRNLLLNHFHCYDHLRWKEILKAKGLNLLKYDYYMTKEAVFLWDLLAFLALILKFAWPFNCLLPGINKWLIGYFKKYYNKDAGIGGALILVAQKGE